MKKVLLTTTALTMMAGAVSAAVAVSGDGRFGVSQTGGVTTVDYRYRVYFKASGETDGGLTFGAKTGLRGDDGVVTRGFGVSLWMSNGTATMRIGNTNGAISTASGVWAIPTVGYTGMSFSGIMGGAGASNSTSSSGGLGPNNVAIDFALGSATVSLSNTIAGNTEIAANFKVGSATIGVGYDNGATAATGGTYVTAAFDAGSAKIGIAYLSPAAGGANHWAIGGSTAIGSGTVAVYSSNKAGVSNYGIGYEQSLGGGAKAAIGYESVGGTATVEAGITFGF